MKEETATKEDIEKQAPAVTSTEKEAVETELRRAVRARMLMVLLLGCPLGYAASYWFQDWYVTGLLEYLRHADYVLVRDAINGAGELHLSWPNINPWVGIFVGSLIVSMLASGRVRRAQVRAKAILTGEEFGNANRRVADTPRASDSIRSYRIAYEPLQSLNRDWSDWLTSRHQIAPSANASQSLSLLLHVGGWLNAGIVWCKPYLFLVQVVLAFVLLMDAAFFGVAFLLTRLIKRSE